MCCVIIAILFAGSVIGGPALTWMFAAATLQAIRHGEVIFREKRAIRFRDVMGSLRGSPL